MSTEKKDEKKPDGAKGAPVPVKVEMVFDMHIAFLTVLFILCLMEIC